MSNTGADKISSKAHKSKGVAVVAAVEGTGGVLVSLCRGKADAVGAVGPGRGNTAPSTGRGNVAPSTCRGNTVASIDRGNTVASSAHVAESPAVRGSVSGFAAGVAGDHLPSRGPEVPLPVTSPAIGPTGDISNIWCHGNPVPGNGWTCGYRGVTRHGGGATRFKDHLAGLSGNCYSCLAVPHHVARVFREVIPQGKVLRRRKKEAKIRVQEEVNFGNNLGTSIDISDDDLDATMRITIQARIDHDSNEAGCSNARGTNALGQKNQCKGYFDKELAYAKTRQQQTLEVCIKKSEYAERLGKAWSKWFHANDIPGHKANCPYFIGALKLTQDLGKGVVAPKGSEIDGIYLQSNYEELQEYVSKFKDDWATYGVTLMTDSWTGPTRMSIINFMIFSNGRIQFHKSVNATGNIQNSQFVYEHIKVVIVHEIGVENIVQLVTDNGSNFKKACLDLVEEYPHIS